MSSTTGDNRDGLSAGGRDGHSAPTAPGRRTGIQRRRNGGRYR
jgi:hypothetical protein